MSSPTPGSPTSTALEWTAAGSRAADLIRAFAMDAVQKLAGLGLSRQNLPVPDRGESSQNGLASADGAARGGYILAEGTNGKPAVILIGTGSEVQIALAARDILQGEGIPACAASMPCVEWFTAQDASYQQEALPPRIRARLRRGRRRAPGHAFAGDLGRVRQPAASWAPAAYQTHCEEFGSSADHMAAAARPSLARLDANAGSEDS